MTHHDVIKLENQYHKAIMFGFDIYGLCAVEWKESNCKARVFQWIRSPVSPVDWKTRCHIDIIILLENTMSIEYANK